jgi:NAD(P)-dependent dehydrogenase (short-subunit alcohol dehydrogenase family)
LTQGPRSVPFMFDAIDQFRLDGRVAIVTGGTRGIGRALAEGFASAGAKVVVASRKADACAQTAAELTALGYEVTGVPCHMGSRDDIANLVAATNQRYGTLDVLVNNAANALAEPVGAYTEAGFDKSIAVNLKGPAFLIQEALPLLRRSENASIINVVSAGAWLFAGMVSLYAAAKAAMFSLTKSMAAELAADGIRVNALAPGTVLTDMLTKLGPEAVEYMAQECLMRRTADPFEMVGPALFLASDAASYVTGTVIHADGGLVTR